MSNYLCIQSEPGVWTVGFYDQRGNWNPESDYATQKEASNRIAFLNGAQIGDTHGDIADQLSRIGDTHEDIGYQLKRIADQLKRIADLAQFEIERQETARHA